MAGEAQFSEPRVRWRLLLGHSSEAALGCELAGAARACDDALAWLYGHDQSLDARGILGPRSACLGSPTVSTVEWIESIHSLFPRETIERLERDAVEKYGIEEVVTNPDVLRRVQPNLAMLQAVLRTRHLMNQAVLQMARELVSRVVEELIRKLAQEVEQCFSAVGRQQRSTPFKGSRELDARTTIRANLKNYDRDKQRLVVQKPYFYPRSRKHRMPWQLILVVDQSGSMLPSVIHSAVTAACLWGVPALKTHLLVFSTEVVDLTGEVTDPVETLMQVQLGGGTDIAQAVEFAAGLIENPRRAILAVVSDFYEGGSACRLVRLTRDIVAQGTHFLGLAALDPDARPAYDRELAGRLVEAGAQVGAMTPGELAAWVAEKVSR